MVASRAATSCHPAWRRPRRRHRLEAGARRRPLPSPSLSVVAATASPTPRIAAAIPRSPAACAPVRAPRACASPRPPSRASRASRARRARARTRARTRTRVGRGRADSRRPDRGTLRRTLRAPRRQRPLQRSTRALHGGPSARLRASGARHGPPALPSPPATPCPSARRAHTRTHTSERPDARDRLATASAPRRQPPGQGRFSVQKGLLR